MSVDLIVHLPRSSMPTSEKWANAILEAGFPVELDPDIDLEKATGFLPCKFRGKESGFEIYPSGLSEQEIKDLEVQAECDFSVCFTTGSDLRELATSLIAAGVLCAISGGQLVDPQSGDRIPAATSIAWVKEQLASFQDEMK